MFGYHLNRLFRLVMSFKEKVDKGVFYLFFLLGDIAQKF
jgi:hypothetical protein